MSEEKSPSAGSAQTSPPLQGGRGRLEARSSLDPTSTRRIRHAMGNRDSTRAARFDTDAIDSALAREMHRPQRESTPGASPRRKRQRINGDRYFENAGISDARQDADMPKIHSESLRTRPTSELQPTSRGWIPCNVVKTKEAHATWRAAFPEEYV